MRATTPFNLICILYLIISSSFFLAFPAHGQENQNRVKLFYLPLENTREDQTFTMKVKLKAKNIDSNPIYDVRAIVCSSNMGISVNEVLLGNIAPGETAVSSESFEISFEDSLSQEAPQTEIVWEIQYVDVNGDLVIEKVLFK